MVERKEKGKKKIKLPKAAEETKKEPEVENPAQTLKEVNQE